MQFPFLTGNEMCCFARSSQASTVNGCVLGAWRNAFGQREPDDLFTGLVRQFSDRLHLIQIRVARLRRRG